MAIASALEIREITVDRLLREGKHLFLAHWEEVAQNRDNRHFELDELRYRGLEQTESLFALAAYEDSTIVGYSVALLIPSHLHDATLPYCASDALFVAESHRDRGVGSKLMRNTESQAKARGAVLVQWHAMAGSELDERLAKSQRYLPQDVTYTRRL